MPRATANAPQVKTPAAPRAFVVAAVVVAIIALFVVLARAQVPPLCNAGNAPCLGFGGGASQAPTPPPGPTAAPSLSPSPVPSPVPSPSASPSAGASPSPSGSPGASPSPSDSPTPSPSPSPSPLPTLPVGSKVFANNALSVVIPPNPTLDLRSAAELATIDAGGSMGRFTIDQTTYRTGTNLGVVSNADPVYSPVCDLTSYGTCTLSTVHIPNGYRDGKGSDFHSTWINQASGTDDEAWLTGSTCSGQNCSGSDVTFPIAAALHVGYGGRALLSGDGTNCNATGGNICLAAGTLRPVDLVNNSLNHGVMLAVQCLQATTYVYPATKSDGLGTTNCAGGTPPRYGQKLWLDPQGVAEVKAINPVVLAGYIQSWNTYGAVLSDRDEGVSGIASGVDPMAVSIDSSSAWGTVISSIVSDPQSIAYANNVTSGAYHINLNMPADIQSRLHVLATCVNTNTCAIPSPSPSPSPAPSSSPTAVPSGTPTTVPAFALWDTMGINAHLSDMQNTTTRNQLCALGIGHVRGSFTNTAASTMKTFRDVYDQCGIKFIMTTAFNHTGGPTSDSANQSMWSQYETVMGAAMEGITGVNEPDINGYTGAEVSQNQRNIWNSTHGGVANLTGKGIVVSGPSILNCSNASNHPQNASIGDLTPYADFWEGHNYRDRRPNSPGWYGAHDCNGTTYQSPRTQGSWAWQGLEGHNYVQNKPGYITESGYCYALAANSGCIPQSLGDAATTYEPELFLAAWMCKDCTTVGQFDYGKTIARHYVYDFLSNGDTNCCDSLGIVATNGTPRPDYYSIQGMLSRLKDTPSTPRALAYTLGGTTTNLVTLPLSYSDGSFGLILLQDVTIWDRTLTTNGPAGCSGSTCYGAEITNVPSDNVTVSLGGAPRLSSVVASTFNQVTGAWSDTTLPTTLPISVSVSAYHFVMIRWR